MQQIVYQFYSAIKHPLPRFLRDIGAADRQAGAAYVPQGYLGRVTLFRATEQPAGICPEPTLGWGKFVAGGVEIHEIPGDHGTIVREPSVCLLAERLGACLDKAQGRATSVTRPTALP